MLDKSIIDLNKKFGDGIIFKFNDGNFPEIPRIHSGSIGLDNILGGGIPTGRMIEVYGEESSGKSTLCLEAVAQAQKAGLPCAYVDGEHAFDPMYAEMLGVDLDNLYLSQPFCLEDGLEIVQTLVKHSVFIVFDSTNSLPPRAELEGDIGDVNIGLAARLFSKAMRVINPTLLPNGSTILWVSQIRDKIGSFGYGNNKSIGVGKALKFYASIRIALARKATNKAGGEAVSNKTIIKIKKNKTATPFMETEVDIVFGKGFDKTGELVDLTIDNRGCIQKGGAWFSLVDTNGEIVLKGQGKLNFVESLDSQPDKLKILEDWYGTFTSDSK